MTGAGGHHGDVENAGYGVFNLPVIFEFWRQGPYNKILRFLDVGNGGKMIQ